VYGQIGFTAELDGLAPSTTYSYRLLANNEYEEGGQTLGGKATGAEGTFTTAAALVPNVQTGASSALTPTSAAIAGTVDPEGVPVSYAFELGVYEGAGTQYGIVASGSSTAGNTPVEENTALSGLQPGTTYAYRLVIHSGQGEARGATATFTTQGLPSVLASPTSPPLLATPSIAFPTETTGSTTTPKALTKTQKLAKALAVCRRDRSKSKRKTCEASAHKQYGTVKERTRA
jgi:phosphodiesterase/alkaline phosphatase D-like protein